MVSANIKTGGYVYSALTKEPGSRTNKASDDFGEIFSMNSDTSSKKYLHVNESNSLSRSDRINNTSSNNDTTEPGTVNDKVDEDSVGEKHDKLISKIKNDLKKNQKVNNNQESDMIMAPVIVNIELPRGQEIQILDKVSEKLGISMNELSGIMDEMSLTAEDLLDQKKLIELAMNVMGLDSTTELLTDTEASDIVKDLLMEMKSIQDSITAQGGAQLVNPNVEVEVVEENLNDDTEESTRTTVKDTESNIEITGEEISTKISEMSKSDKGSDKSDAKNHQFNENQFFDTTGTMTDKLAQAITEAAGETSQAQIISQIVEQIKVQAKPDVTSMEMQLYPEHLGKVTIQVASKDGAITAQIAAETESAKVAIEQQLTLLKDSLNNQGIKIQAIEVTIASHGFEQNLDNGGSKNEEQSSRHGRVRKGLLDELSGEIDFNDISEEQVMETKGNTVSYSA